jgi:hypothetical protein
MTVDPLYQCGYQDGKTPTLNESVMYSILAMCPKKSYAEGYKSLDANSTSLW